MSNLLNIKDQSGNWIPIPVVTNGIKSITQNEDYTLTITLNDGTTYTTTSIKGEDGQDYILTEQDKQDIAGLVDTPVEDVQINGTSILQDGVANIPVASKEQPGVVKVFGGYGLLMEDQFIRINPAATPLVKSGLSQARTIVPANQHEAAFYGLAKASGDTTQSQSDNPVGIYTDEAKASIKNMLGVEDVDIDSKAPVITETATGSIVSFDDGADDIPLQSLVVDINPVQDLHGYDHPWVGGGGKNLLKPPSSGGTINGVTFVINNDETVVANGTSGSSYNTDLYFIGGPSTYENVNIPSGDYILTGCGTTATVGRFYVIEEGSTPKTQENNVPLNIALDNTKKYRMFIRIFSGQTVTNQKYEMMIRLASESDATFAPYENICPISGWTGCEIKHTGVNLFDGVIESGDYDVTDIRGGAKRSNAERMRCANFIPVKPNTTYYSKSSYKNSIVVFYDEEKWMHSGGYAVARNTTFTTPSWCKYITFYYADTQYNNDISINYPATDHDYHLYAGHSITIDLGQTVYGGYVDVLSGKLIVEMLSVTIDSSKITRDTATRFHVAKSYIGDFLTSGYSAMNKFRLKTSSDGYNASGTYFMDTNNLQMNAYRAFDTKAEFVEEYGELQFVFTLATPIEIQLDARTINSLLGQNNIFADTGDVNMTYRADSELYIDKQIPDVPVQDIQINGTSVVSDGVANVPMASANELGAVSVNGSYYGVSINPQDGGLYLSGATDSAIKAGNATYRVIFPSKQHQSVFYGLAKAAGDTTQSSSSNAVGTYTDSAKTAIKNMLGVIDGGGTISETVTGTDPTITAQNNFRYMCGELYTLNFTPCVSGVCEVIFTSGATPTVLTLPDTVRMPAWWTGVEANTTYEISIVDGVYGAVMSWS